ncbi:MAG TPA: aminopeptidase [Anaerolineae bacterium]|nr:aminopeptidase [Anaerolineae bacterium]
MELTPFLKSLLSTSGLSAYETPAAKIIEEAWQPLVDEVQYSKIGSLEAFKKGTLTSTSPDSAPLSACPSIMLAAHMDAIGMMVTKVQDGFLRVTQIGGVDARVLPGTPVTVHASRGGKPEELPGIVVQPAVRLLPASMADNPVPMDHLFIETGLLPKDVAAKVQIGDLVSYATEPVELAGEALAGHSLDNRASVAVVTVALDELQKKSHTWDVWAVATAQEEVSLGGAFTSAHGLRPDLAVAIDVTFAKGPGANDWQTFPFGKGPTLGFGPNLHPFLFKKFEELAKNLEIPYQTEVIPRHSGTDAYAMQVSAEGIPTMVIGIPLRYMHTPVEVVALKDIQRAGRLLAEFIAALEPDFVEKIVWED